MTNEAIWKYAVDIAQILSAIGTALAVVVSLTLARRSEKQRPKIFIGFNQTFDMPLQFGEVSQSFDVTGTVVNAGLLPLWVKSTLLHVPNKSEGWGWGTGGKGDFELQHGRQHIHHIRITPDNHWRLTEKQIGFLHKNRPYYSITTSLGKTYKVRMSYAQVKTLKRMINATLTGNFTGPF